MAKSALSVGDGEINKAEIAFYGCCMLFAVTSGFFADYGPRV
jgi:hypothetical protein